MIPGGTVGGMPITPGGGIMVPWSGIMLGGGATNALFTGNVVVAVGISFDADSGLVGREGGTGNLLSLLLGGEGNGNSGFGGPDGLGSAAIPGPPSPGGGPSVGFSLMS